jgi:hypothetical protein
MPSDSSTAALRDMEHPISLASQFVDPAEGHYHEAWQAVAGHQSQGLTMVTHVLL